MSRNRYDRDDDSSNYGRGGRSRSGSSSGGGWGSEDRYGSDRGDYGYGGGARGTGRDYGSIDYGSRGGEVSGGRSSYGRDYGRDYGRGPADESRSGGYGDADYGESRDRDDYGRSLYDEGYSRGRYGAERSRRGKSPSRVRCRDIMTKDVVVATRETTVQQVGAMMRDEDTGVIPVVERRDAAASSESGNEAVPGSGRSNYGKLVGLITDRDIVIRAVAEGKDATLTRAEDVMTTDIHSAQPNDRVVDAIRKMGDKQVRRIPVVDGSGNLRGIISMADVALETEEDRELADALEEISSGASFWSKIFG